MAELTVKGFSNKELKCDMVEYTFTFSKDGDSIAEAIANKNVIFTALLYMLR